MSLGWDAIQTASGLPSEGFGYRNLGLSQAGLRLAEALGGHTTCYSVQDSENEKGCS